MADNLAISSMSLGRAWAHRLQPKLEQMARHGFSGVELFFEDLSFHAQDKYGSMMDTDLKKAADDIQLQCGILGLTIVCLQPLMHFEGLTSPQEREAAFTKAELWFDLARRLGTDLIGVPSSFLPASKTTGDVASIVRDFKALASRAAQYSLRISYEALCWGTHIDTWEASWDIVQRVNMPNFGLCLDTFNIAGRIYADPTSGSGCTRDAQSAVDMSMKRLVDRVDVNKVFFVQVVDAERLAQPLLPGHVFDNPEQPPRMSWSRNCRLFYGETDRGAYLPVQQIMDAITHGLKYQGWISMELFNRSLNDTITEVPAEHARRGIQSGLKLIQDMAKLRQASRYGQRSPSSPTPKPMTTVYASL